MTLGEFMETDEAKEQLARLAEYQALEALNPELEAHLSDEGTFTVLRHPLVVSLYSPGMNKQYNAMLAQKMDSVAEALAENDFTGYVMLHERPFRLDAVQLFLTLREVADELYWEVLGHVWSDSENIFENQSTWCRLLAAGRLGRDHFMLEEDREAYAQLPDELTIYRGIGGGHNPKGLSWTLDEGRAKWFAKRMLKTPTVLRRVVRKEQTLAYVSRRNEEEIVLLPSARGGSLKEIA